MFNALGRNKPFVAYSLKKRGDENDDDSMVQ